MNVFQTFLCAAENGNLSKAAEELYTSQSTVSRNIAELEKELGCILFNRTHHGVKLTHAGLMIYGQIQRLVDSWEQIRFEASHYRIQQGTLRVGYAYFGILPLVSKAFEYKDFPIRELSLSLQYGQGSDLCNMIREGYLDCAILHRPSVVDTDGIHSIRITSCSMNILLSPLHASANQKSITMVRLSEETEVRCSREPEFYKAADNAFYIMGLKPMKHVTVVEPDDCVLMVRHKNYVCYRPSIYPSSPGCVLLSITDWPTDYDLMLVCRKENTNLAIESFYSALQSLFTE
jgi:DNA-binding transcriptional LysR family regulator